MLAEAEEIELKARLTEAKLRLLRVNIELQELRKEQRQTRAGS